MINLSITPPWLAYVYGGKEVHIQFTTEVVETLQWAIEYRKQLQREIDLRNTNPALADQWDHYQTLLRIVMDDV